MATLDTPLPFEETITALWQALLGAASMKPTDDFFERGGNSLLAARAAARLQEILGLEVGLRDLFEAPTARQLAATLRDAPRIQADEIGHVPRDGMTLPLPLSPAQQR